ncbi:15593_t:CDS:2 [Gigaspora margarita]|uniref:15593_t:CDS:1 n=1 Tax=Gigaspora margarita TaxID=4874 RepID=A0ABN7VW93_GIGMA|nr:15593_t:CDS:2 [Gigaspora margarita]
MSYYPYDLIYPELREENSRTIANSKTHKKQELESDEESFTDETSVPSDEFDSAYNSDETEEELFELCFYNENNELVYDNAKMAVEEADVEDIDSSKKFPEESFLDYCDSDHEMNSSQESLYESFQDTVDDVNLSQEILDASKIDSVGNVSILSNKKTDIIRGVQRLTGQSVENIPENEDLQNQENANKHSLLYILGDNQLFKSCQNDIAPQTLYAFKEAGINPNKQSNDKVNPTDIMQSMATSSREPQFNNEVSTSKIPAKSVLTNGEESAKELSPVPNLELFNSNTPLKLDLPLPTKNKTSRPPIDKPYYGPINQNNFYSPIIHKATLPMYDPHVNPPFKNNEWLFNQNIYQPSGIHEAPSYFNEQYANPEASFCAKYNQNFPYQSIIHESIYMNDPYVNSEMARYRRRKSAFSQNFACQSINQEMIPSPSEDIRPEVSRLSHSDPSSVPEVDRGTDDKITIDQESKLSNKTQDLREQMIECWSSHKLEEDKSYKKCTDPCLYAYKGDQPSIIFQKGQYACNEPSCNYRFLRQSDLENHIIVHIRFKPFTCKHSGCNQSFPWLYLLEKHLLTHETGGPLKCDYSGCDREFMAPSHLIEHQSEHNSERFFDAQKSWNEPSRYFKE